MTRDDIIRMAREAGCIARRHPEYWDDVQVFATPDVLERFAALVAAAEREAILKEGYRKCAEGQKTTQFCGMLQQAVLTEREACAKVCESLWNYPENGMATEEECYGDECAKAIRARGQA
jgi:hypothetical protein